MGMKQILPIAAGAAILAASGGLAAPALTGAAGAGTAGAAGAGTAGAAGAGAGGLLGAASGMTGTALGSSALGAGTGATLGAGTAATSIPSVLEGSGLVGSAAGGLADIATTAVPSAMNTLNSAALAGGTTGLGSALIPTMNLANSTVINPLSAWDKVKGFADKYGTVQNVTGAGNLAMKYADMNQARPMQSQGQIVKGQAPTMEGLLALQQAGYGLPQRKKLNLGLIG